MASIIGENFKKYVRNQVNTRQNKLGQQNRDPDLLKYISNKTSWLSLASSININGSNRSAKENVLFGGKSVNNSNISYNSNSVYSHSSNYGFVPQPGIISADLKSKNRGSLVEAVVNIVCHNVEQFNIIEKLYLRLNYSVLLEWGHTLWYDNNGTLHSDRVGGVLQQQFLNGVATQDGILEEIEKQREYSCGNYDALFGFVSNFSWTIRQDGGYDITLNLISGGDIIESFKINTNYPILNTSTTSTSTTSDELPSVIVNKDKSTINTILYDIKYQIDFAGFLDGMTYNGNIDKFKLDTQTLAQSTGFINSYISPDEVIARDQNQDNGQLTYQEGIFADFTNLDTNVKNDTVIGRQYYIKLGAFLRILQNFLIKYDGRNKPLFYIDYNFNNNYCFTIPNQSSIDPTVCLLPAPSLENINEELPYIKKTTIEQYDNAGWIALSINVNIGINGYNPTFPPTITEILEDVPSTVITDLDTGEPYDASIYRKTTYSFPDKNQRIIIEIEPRVLFAEEATLKGNLSNITDFYKSTGNSFAAKFMHTHVNLNFITNVLDDNIDNEGKVTLYKLLQDLMNGIQNATGCINDFDVTYDRFTNYFVIRDNTAIPGLKPTIPELTIFNTGILTLGNGSFITDASVKSELTNNFKTMISIGAQANGNKVGENATAFSKWNTGLIDRIVPDKTNKLEESTTDATSSMSPEQMYVGTFSKYTGLIRAIDDKSVSQDYISSIKQPVVDMFKYEIGYYTQQGNIPGIGFIPISLNLTMDGLSGMRLFEGYSITEIFLPQNYRNNIKFITKGINHKIDGNGWVTSIDSLSIPKFEGDKTFKNAPIKKKSSSTTSTTDVKKAEKLLGGCKNQKSYRYTTPSSSDWKSLIAELIRKKEAGGKLTTSTIGTLDQNAYRAGYGSDIVLRNGKPITVQKGMVVTAAEAEDTLINYSIPTYSNLIIENGLGQQNWDKLNNNQKSALMSLAYNAGAYSFERFPWGKNIVKAISNNDLTLAGNLIYDQGPVTGAKEGYLTGLEKRRKEESILFLTPDNVVKTETFSIPGKRC
jgi:GH24 family phage-related lysozyme (muramidase)